MYFDFMRRKYVRRRAAAAVLVVVTLPVLFGMAAMTVDVGYMYAVRAELQNTADASALAAAQALPDQNAARNSALDYAERNGAHLGDVLTGSDVSFGHWDSGAGTFTPGGAPVNAVHVLVQCSEANGNPLSLFFAPILGIVTTEVSASATALAGAASTPAVRFLIDDEMFDTDVPVIQDLADDLGTSEDWLLSDNNGDDFIDIPGGTVLELPTGQTGDEALFEIDPTPFEFTQASSPSLVDFLLYDENGDKHGLTDSDLDPLVGVEPANSSDFTSFVNPEQVLLSPVYKSDVSNTSPWVNAKGERRGLVAFKIIGLGTDPDGAGSKFRNLILEIVDPSTISIEEATLSVSVGSAPVQLVQ